MNSDMNCNLNSCFIFVLRYVLKIEIATNEEMK